MEYYLAVRMRRFGRAFQSTEPTTTTPERPVDRTLGRSPSATNGGTDPVVAVSTATPPRLAVRPVGRPGERPPGRY
jgi:hypothetical protein